MNYYERHLGDYAKDTAHLTMIEHGAYSLLLDRYYGTEQGIPADQAHRVARARTREEKQAVDAVLGEFFTLVDGIWINQRAEEEIVKAQAKIKAAQENGKRGGRPKKNPTGSETETQEKPSGFYVGSETETQEKAHQTPDTSTHLLPPEEDCSVVSPNSGTATPAGSSQGPTRAGVLCRKLREHSIDAAPHMPVLLDLLGRFTDEEILAVAEIAKDRKPNERIHLNYLVPILNDQSKPQQTGATKRRPAADNFDNRDYGKGGKL